MNADNYKPDPARQNLNKGLAKDFVRFVGEELKAEAQCLPRQVLGLIGRLLEPSPPQDDADRVYIGSKGGRYRIVNGRKRYDV